MHQHPTPKTIDRKLLKAWKLPSLDLDADKEARGAVLIVAGYSELAGAAVLAAEAALRAGAGKLKIGTTAKAALQIGLSVPEAMVHPLASVNEVLSPGAARFVHQKSERLASLLIGPGLKEGASLLKVLATLLQSLKKDQSEDNKLVLIFDAAALTVFEKKRKLAVGLMSPPIITPHAGEMASLLGLEKEEVEENPSRFALELAKEANLVVALKGNETFIASPDQKLFALKGDNPGLATSGSGDVLAGLIAGLAARGCDPLQAAVWGVYLHSTAGAVVSKDIGKIGFLARELSGRIPKIIDSL